MRDKICTPYVDDVIVYLRTFEELIENVHNVLRSLKEHGVKLKPSTCHMFQVEVRDLGSDSIDAILALKHTKPKTVGDVRKILGLLGYF